MTSKFQELLTNLDELGLDKMRAYLPEYIDELNQQQVIFTDALLRLTTVELTWQDQLQTDQIIK